MRGSARGSVPRLMAGSRRRPVMSGNLLPPAVVGSAAVRVAIADARLYVDVLAPEFVVSGPQLVHRPTIVLLHGGPGFDCSLNRETAAPWTDFASVIVYDHRGNGRSDRGEPA